MSWFRGLDGELYDLGTFRGREEQRKLNAYQGALDGYAAQERHHGDDAGAHHWPEPRSGCPCGCQDADADDDVSLTDSQRAYLGLLEIRHVSWDSL